MSSVDASVVFLPRPTALCGAATFTTAPLDVSSQGGAQFQVWRGPVRVASGSGSLTLYLEESLDAESWSLGPSTPQGIVLGENQVHFLSYSFRLRWFRLKFTLAGNSPFVSCWAEGLLRGGDGGLWNRPEGLSSAAGQVVGRTAEDAGPDDRARKRVLERLSGVVVGYNSRLTRRGTPLLTEESLSYLSEPERQAYLANIGFADIQVGQGPALAPPNAVQLRPQGGP